MAELPLFACYGQRSCEEEPYRLTGFVCPHLAGKEECPENMRKRLEGKMKKGGHAKKLSFSQKQYAWKKNE